MYSAARPSKRNGLIAIWCDKEYLTRAEPLRRAGLSAAAEICLRYCFNHIFGIHDEAMHFIFQKKKEAWLEHQPFISGTVDRLRRGVYMCLHLLPTASK